VRPYTKDNRLETLSPAGRRDVWQVWRREDRRLTAGADLVLKLTRRFELVFRADTLLNRSNVDGRLAAACLEAADPCHPAAYQNRNFDKLVGVVELGVAWP
jgi:hypothetical protein